MFEDDEIKKNYAQERGRKPPERFTRAEKKKIKLATDEAVMKQDPEILRLILNDLSLRGSPSPRMTDVQIERALDALRRMFVREE